MGYIAYYIELNLKICNYAQKNDAFVAKLANTRQFGTHRKAANFCHPVCQYNFVKVC